MTDSQEKAVEEQGEGADSEIKYITDPNFHNLVQPEDRGPGMDEPKHYTYARPEEKPPDRDVRLVDAVKEQNSELVEQLLKDGADIHQRAEQDWTPLNFAAGKGDLKTVKLLIDNGADCTVVGRDRRRPLAIAKAASRKEVAGYLTKLEKKLGVWEDPTELRPYIKAYQLKELRAFAGWSEERKNWSINKYWPDDIKAEYEKDFEDEDAVFLHQDFTVTKSMWHNENVIFSNVTKEWESFVKDKLKWAIPDDLK